eukprot:TRINITY_DN1546_c0_g1_i1.p2 TRINITY_DN1546_c0_g1~~TRINITY_DN1546_c0_g1_i1.p2  ORF type:complete len:1274 (+),score=355.18 TRINITY_DN1546_c0_g1_i1:4186-8007(+)
MFAEGEAALAAGFLPEDAVDQILRNWRAGAEENNYDVIEAAARIAGKAVMRDKQMPQDAVKIMRNRLAASGATAYQIGVGEQLATTAAEKAFALSSSDDAVMSSNLARAEDEAKTDVLEPDQIMPPGLTKLAVRMTLKNLVYGSFLGNEMYKTTAKDAVAGALAGVSNVTQEDVRVLFSGLPNGTEAVKAYTQAQVTILFPPEADADEKKEALYKMKPGPLVAAALNAAFEDFRDLNVRPAPIQVWDLTAFPLADTDPSAWAEAGKVAAHFAKSDGKSANEVAKAAAEAAAVEAISAGQPVLVVAKAAVDAIRAAGGKKLMWPRTAAYAAQLAAASAGMPAKDVVKMAVVATNITASRLSYGPNRLKNELGSASKAAGAFTVCLKAAEKATEAGQKAKLHPQTIALNAGAAAARVGDELSLSSADKASVAGQAATAAAKALWLSSDESTLVAALSAQNAGGNEGRIARAAGVAAAMHRMSVMSPAGEVASACWQAVVTAGGSKGDASKLAGLAAGEAVSLTDSPVLSVAQEEDYCFAPQEVDRYQKEHNDMDEALVRKPEDCKMLCIERRCKSYDVRPEGDFGHYRCSLSSTKAGEKDGGDLMYAVGSIYQQTKRCRKAVMKDEISKDMQDCRNPSGKVRFVEQSSPFVNRSYGEAVSLPGGGAFSKMVWSEQWMMSGGTGVKFRCSDPKGFVVVALSSNWELTGSSYMPDGHADYTLYCRGGEKVLFQARERTISKMTYKPTDWLALKINDDSTVSFYHNNVELGRAMESKASYPLHVSINFGGSDGAVSDMEYTTGCKACVTQAGYGGTAHPHTRCVHGQPTPEGIKCFKTGNYGDFGWCYTDDAKVDWGSCAESCEDNQQEDADCVTVDGYFGTADAGTACQFGVDRLDEGTHCIKVEDDWGPYGWCWVDQTRVKWGSCSRACEKASRKKQARSDLFRSSDEAEEPAGKPGENVPVPMTNTNPEGYGYIAPGRGGGKGAEDSRSTNWKGYTKKPGKGQGKGKGGSEEVVTEKDGQQPMSFTTVSFEILGVSMSGLPADMQESIRKAVQEALGSVAPRPDIVDQIDVSLSGGYGTSGFGSLRVDAKLTIPQKGRETEDVSALQGRLMGGEWGSATAKLVAQIRDLKGIEMAVTGEISCTQPFVAWSGSGVLANSGRSNNDDILKDDLVDPLAAHRNRKAKHASHSEVFMRMLSSGAVIPWLFAGLLITVPLSVLLAAVNAALMGGKPSTQRTGAASVQGDGGTESGAADAQPGGGGGIAAGEDEASDSEGD